MPAVAAFVGGVGEKGRQAAEGFLGGVDRHRDCHVLVERHALRLRQKLQRIAVLGVGGEERDGQAKRLVDRSVAQEFERVVFVALRHVDFGAVGLVEPVIAIVGSTEIEAFGREFSIVPFPHVTHMVAVFAE